MKNGSQVKQGDLLYQFDLKNTIIDLQNLKDEIKIIKRQLNLLSNNNNKNIDSDIYIANNAKSHLEKITSLYAQGYATQGELFNAKKEYYAQKDITYNKQVSLQQNKDDLFVLLNEKKSQLQKAKFHIQNASVISAYDGYLIGSNIKVGSQVAKNSTMGTIINIEYVTVKAGLAPGLYPFIKEGDTVHIDFIVTPPYSIDANITRIIPVVDPEFGRMVVDIELKNFNFILQDGMKAMVKIKLKKEYQEKVREFFIEKKDQVIVEIGSDIG